MTVGTSEQPWDIVEAGGGSTVPAAPHAASVVTSVEDRHGQALFGFARRLGIDDAAAADVVQEGLLRLFEVLNRGSRVDDPRAWVFTVVYRLAMDEHRRRDRWSRLVTSVGRIGPVQAEDGVDRSDQAVVWAEVDRLPERQRAVLYLRYRADLPYEGVARVLGITASAARSHATQAVATLRARLVGVGEP